MERHVNLVLSNEYLIANIDVDTAENEPLKGRSIFELRDFMTTDHTPLPNLPPRTSPFGLL